MAPQEDFPRRTLQEAESDALRLGQLMLVEDFGYITVRLEGTDKRCKLTEYERRILSLLMIRAGQGSEYVKREEIWEAIYVDVPEEKRPKSNVLAGVLHGLRRKLRELSDSTIEITVTPNKGYTLRFKNIQKD